MCFLEYLTAFLWPPDRAGAQPSFLRVTPTTLGTSPLHTGLPILSKFENLTVPQGFGAPPSPICYTSFSLVPHSAQLTCHLWGGRGRTVPATSLFLFWSHQGSFADKVASLFPHPPSVCYLHSAPPWEPTLVASKGPRSQALCHCRVGAQHRCETACRLPQPFVSCTSVWSGS